MSFALINGRAGADGAALQVAAVVPGSMAEDLVGDDVRRAVSRCYRRLLQVAKGLHEKDGGGLSRLRGELADQFP